MNYIRILLLFFFLTLAGYSSADAQACQIGDKISVVIQDGTKCVGCFSELKKYSIVVFNDDGDNEFFNNNIEELHVYKRGVSRNVRTGLIIGASAGLAIVLANLLLNSENIDNDGKSDFDIFGNIAILLGTTGVGALIGAIIESPIPVNKADLFEPGMQMTEYPRHTKPSFGFKLSFNF